MRGWDRESPEVYTLDLNGMPNNAIRYPQPRAQLLGSIYVSLAKSHYFPERARLHFSLLSFFLFFILFFSASWFPIITIPRNHSASLYNPQCEAKLRFVPRLDFSFLISAIRSKTSLLTRREKREHFDFISSSCVLNPTGAVMAP